MIDNLAASPREYNGSGRDAGGRCRGVGPGHGHATQARLVSGRVFMLQMYSQNVWSGKVFGPLCERLTQGSKAGWIGTRSLSWRPGTMRILITGTSGRLGAAFAQHLAREHMVIGLDVAPGPYTTHRDSITNRSLNSCVSRRRSCASFSCGIMMVWW